MTYASNYELLDDPRDPDGMVAPWVATGLLAANSYFIGASIRDMRRHHPDRRLRRLGEACLRLSAWTSGYNFSREAHAQMVETAAEKRRREANPRPLTAPEVAVAALQAVSLVCARGRSPRGVLGALVAIGVQATLRSFVRRCGPAMRAQLREITTHREETKSA